MGFSTNNNAFSRLFVLDGGRFRDYLAFNGFFSDDGFSISYLTNGYPVNLASLGFGNLPLQVINATCPYASPSCS